ncbi:response regulator [Paramaledivibacter caminithermalis]|jgi:two-component system response regulator YesN|uniref:Stage 0 sporulation protein A homolog n=1 Tax=Paramaledivibacter caminithermalis (strain DSM 15212 / CIP 107654 / DViRD3) TaxID=1121301 RepID=A0A1M6NTC6_PARC5|nr:response regulator [Paramaledivibacter caminithermalis]SHJ98987.1 two-component system, response regulator YesN [Paramaledivibacter caminithermalis DSM 15212]
MLRLMIAEDEALERKALKFLVEKFYKDEINIISEAFNGIDAVEKAIKHKPDIILMDISMPIMDGLKAASLIRKQLVNTEFIILTAYSYFEYAKEAIKLGMNDYLLKPVSDEEFCNSINKLLKKIYKRREEVNRFLELKKQQLELVPLLEKEIIIKTIYGVELPYKEYLDYLKMLKINSKYFTCLIFKGNKTKDFNGKIEATIKNKLKFKISHVISYIYLNEIVFILFDDKLMTKTNDDELSSLLVEIENSIRDAFNIDVCVGVSRVFDSTSKLHLAYNEAKQSSSRNGDRNEEIHLYSYEKEQIIFKKIANEDLDGALNVFEEIFNSIINNSESFDVGVIKKKLKEFLLVLNRNIVCFWGDDFRIFKMSEVEEYIGSTNNLMEISSYIKDLIKEIITNISENKKDRGVIIAEEVKAYINDNYMRNISLDEVADHIKLSSYYLCKIFKKVEKINFKDYLIKIRMEEAKKMLRQGDKSIKEIAFEVGYTDPNYFSRAFKKYVGKSATEYSKL